MMHAFNKILINNRDACTVFLKTYSKCHSDTMCSIHGVFKLCHTSKKYAFLEILFRIVVGKVSKKHVNKLKCH